MEDKNFSVSNEQKALIGRFVKTSKEKLIVDGAARTVDITPLEGARFTENTQLSSTYGGNRA